MRLTLVAPSPPLAPFVRSFTLIETREEMTRLLVPDGIVLGIRFGGQARELDDSGPLSLPNATLVGMRDTARRMWTSGGGAVVLATFHEGGAAPFFAQPLHELFGATAPLDVLAPPAEVERVSSRVAEAADHAERVAIVERFLLARYGAGRPDAIATEAARLIRAASGPIRIAALAARLSLGQDRLEKRFRRAVGASPRRLASVLRLRRAIADYRHGESLTGISARAGYFDQSHFSREFRAAMGETPSRFFRAADYC